MLVPVDMVARFILLFRLLEAFCQLGLRIIYLVIINAQYIALQDMQFKNAYSYVYTMYEFSYSFDYMIFFSIIIQSNRCNNNNACLTRRRRKIAVRTLCFSCKVMERCFISSTVQGCSSCSLFVTLYYCTVLFVFI